MKPIFRQASPGLILATSFPEAGMIGLWPKADAQSYFDDLTIDQ